LRIADFKLDPRAAVRALERDALAATPASQRGEIQRLMVEALTEQSLLAHYRVPDG
jgi:hypothetical protein